MNTETKTENISSKSDQDLLQELAEMAEEESCIEYGILQLLKEVENRRLHLKMAKKSLLDFVVEHLRCSDATAYRRVNVIKISEKFPIILEYIKDQRLTLTGAGLLSKHLTEDNCASLLGRASYLSTRKIAELLPQR